LKEDKYIRYYLAGKCLISLSFRYSEKEKNSIVFFATCFFKAVLSGKIKPEKSYTKYSEGREVFYDIAKSSEKSRTEYLKYFLKRPINGGIWKETLLGYFTLQDKVAQFLFLSGLFFFLMSLALFSRLRASLGLIFLEYIETANLILLAKKNNTGILYYFSIYEKDSNIATLGLQKMDIKVVKIPSEVPLFFWNKIIIADTLILCDSNQIEELELYKNTIHISTTDFWGPERCVEVIAKYKLPEIREKSNNKTLGFYSTAAYIRNMEGNIIQKNMLEEEDRIKTFLSEYLKINKSSRIAIFLHPKEKDIKYIEIAKKHYSNYFGGLNYNLIMDENPSSYNFELVELGISFHSTIMYERLFFGFKCLTFTSSNANFPLHNTALYNICAEDKGSLFNKIDLFLHFSVNEYFSHTGIKKSPFFQNI
jgi:hypothetical protein